MESALSECEAQRARAFQNEEDLKAELMVYMRAADPVAAYGRELRMLLAEGRISANDEVAMMQEEVQAGKLVASKRETTRVLVYVNSNTVWHNRSLHRVMVCITSRFRPVRTFP